MKAKQRKKRGPFSTSGNRRIKRIAKTVDVNLLNRFEKQKQNAKSQVLKKNCNPERIKIMYFQNICLFFAVNF